MEWSNKKIIFVYGSLKEGFYNHDILGDIPQNKKLGGSFISGYKLYSEDEALLKKYGISRKKKKK